MGRQMGTSELCFSWLKWVAQKVLYLDFPNELSNGEWLNIIKIRSTRTPLWWSHSSIINETNTQEQVDKIIEKTYNF